MPIRPEFYVSLKGKQYPTYPGVLIAAMEAGLKSLTVSHVQLPSEENGNTAVMKARAEFEDGRVFEDYGDCSPRNTSPQIAVASIRMASTRAKGRVLRDGIGLGETLKEELPDDADETPGRSSAPAPAVRPVDAPRQGETEDAGGVCSEPGCGEVINRNQTTLSKQKFGRPLCPTHQRTQGK